MKIKCEVCGKEFNKKPSALKVHNYCSKECRHRATHVELVCETCGKSFSRLKCQTLKHSFCSLGCVKEYTSRRMSDMNELLNPTRMDSVTRFKIREHREGTWTKDGYSKLYGRHAHRVVAEIKLGRPLQKGEVVHHIDGDKRNNSPENLMVFCSQKEHAEYHAKLKREENERT